MRVLQLGLGAARREAVPERVLPGFLRRSVRLWIDKVSSAEEQAWRETLLFPSVSFCASFSSHSRVGAQLHSYCTSCKLIDVF